MPGLLQIAFYGKGGIGKSTIASNVSVAAAQMGYRVLQLGCSPKADSTALLNSGRWVPDILSNIKLGRASRDEVSKCIVEGYAGVLCAESGGPEPAKGCAGKGASLALDMVTKGGFARERGVDLIIYDVIADVVCGGFAQPIRAGYANLVYIVTSGELMSVYQGNNVCRAISEFCRIKGPNVKLGGIVANLRGVDNETDILEDFAKALGTQVLAFIPRDNLILEAEVEGGTVLEKRPNSPVANIFRSLAKRIVTNEDLVIPKPLGLEDIVILLRHHQRSMVEQVQSQAPSLDDAVPAREPKVPYDKLFPLVIPAAKPRKISVYGKGGIGKSTLSSNLSCCLADMGYKVMQVGCDPKRDSVATVCGELIHPILNDAPDEQNLNLTEAQVDKFIHTGYNEVLCVECGGPIPGMGCAGTGVSQALELLQSTRVYERHDVDIVIYDVLGDVVCGGFAKPLRGGNAREVYIVTCAEFSALFQTNNIAKSVRRIRDNGEDCCCAGLINNMRGIPNEEKIVEEIAEKMGVPVIAHIPRSPLVQAAEFYTKTVMQVFPESSQASAYHRLAHKVLENDRVYLPNPLSIQEIREILAHYRSS